jgi:hypothetical protein
VKTPLEFLTDFTAFWVADHGYARRFSPSHQVFSGIQIVRYIHDMYKVQQQCIIYIQFYLTEITTDKSN